MTVLDIAAGVGEPGFQVAPLLGPDGRLISTDLAPAAVEQARRRAKELDLTNVEVQVMDAQHMDLPDNSVDRVLCRWGFMLMPDPAAAMSETRRVVRPDGRLVFSVWGPAEENPWPYRIRRVLEDQGRIDRIELTAPTEMFSLPNEEALRPLLEAAGWRLLELERIPLEMPYRDFEEYWAWSVDMGGEASGVLRQMPEPEVAEVKGLVEAGVQPFREGDGYRFPALALGVLAT